MATSPAAHKTRKRPGASGKGYVRRMGDRLFAVHDAWARQRGWQITVQTGGLGRSYRDPRFDLLVSCPDCHGAGDDASDQPCSCCLGTGRRVLDRYRGSAAR
jgi:hypothetical protein